MKSWLIVAAPLCLSMCASAQAAKPCEELKSEIAQKLEAKNVKSYSLEIVAKDKETDAKVVGTCDGGTKKIVYTKNVPAAQEPTAEKVKQ